MFDYSLAANEIVVVGEIGLVVVGRTAVGDGLVVVEGSELEAVAECLDESRMGRAEGQNAAAVDDDRQAERTEAEVTMGVVDSGPVEADTADYAVEVGGHIPHLATEAERAVQDSGTDFDAVPAGLAAETGAGSEADSLGLAESLRVVDHNRLAVGLDNLHTAAVAGRDILLAVVHILADRIHTVVDLVCIQDQAV